MQGKINNREEGPGIRMLFSRLSDLQQYIASERQGLPSCGRLSSSILPILEVGIIGQFGCHEILVLMPAVDSQKS